MLKRINLPAILLISFIIKLLITGTSIGEAVGLLSLSSLYGFYLSQDERRAIPVNKAITDRLTLLEEQHLLEKNNELLTRIIQLEEQTALTRDKVNSINLGSQFKR